MPKGVMLSHYNIVAQARQGEKGDLRTISWDTDAQLGVLPFFHIYVRPTPRPRRGYT
jgi:long-subunit acyl-CoA synthetase (AMP-forming)